jgi:hypothetical protein
MKHLLLTAAETKVISNINEKIEAIPPIEEYFDKDGVCTYSKEHCGPINVYNLDKEHPLLIETLFFYLEVAPIELQNDEPSAENEQDLVISTQLSKKLHEYFNIGQYNWDLPAGERLIDSNKNNKKPYYNKL